MSEGLVNRSMDRGFAMLLVTVGAIGLVVVRVPELRWFLALSLACGGIVAAGMFAWRARHATDAAVRSGERLGPVQINIARVPIGAGLAGLLVAGGSVGILLIGLQQARWFFAATLACGIVVAVVLVEWRKGHPGEQSPENTLRPR